MKVVKIFVYFLSCDRQIISVVNQLKWKIILILCGPIIIISINQMLLSADGTRKLTT